MWYDTEATQLQIRTCLLTVNVIHFKLICVIRGYGDEPRYAGASLYSICCQPFICFVSEHPFLNISYRHQSTVVVREGRKRLVFEPKVNALPLPDTLTWQVVVLTHKSRLPPRLFSLNWLICLTPRYKDGVPILKNSTCYKISGYNLIISDVQQKHDGVFTISLGNQAHRLYRNLSYTLEVEGNLLLLH